MPTYPSRALLRVGGVAAATYAVVLTIVVLRVGVVLHVDQDVVVGAHHAVRSSRLLLLAAQVLVNLGSPVVVGVVVVAAALWASRRRLWRVTIYLLAVRAVSLTISTACKLLIHRQRPNFADAVAHGDGFSFPSGHASGAAGTYVSLLLAAAVLGFVRSSRRRTALAVLAAAAILVVAAGRVLLGVHFPTDVVGGAALGLAVACLLTPVLRSARG
ncbi:MAG: hypothetical protein NVS3B26_12590 [Mycobacteriales bacterium]